MGWVLPEVVLQRVLTVGLKKLRADKDAFYDLFCQYTQDEIGPEYGPDYLDKLWLWFSTTKIPVVQAWSMNTQKIPCISVHLANETEDEQKAAIGDMAGEFDQVGETGTGVFTVMLDIGIHANKGGDHVLWIYYIVSYILYKHKMMAERLGLKLHTFTASDYNKDASKMTENIWTRWIRFRCTTQNFWSGDEFMDIEDISVEASVGNTPAGDLSVSIDVDESEVDTTANKGLIASRAGDDEGEEDLNI